MSEFDINNSIDTNSINQNENTGFSEDSVEQPEEKDNNILKDEMYYFGLFEAVLFLSNEPLEISYFSKKFDMDGKDVKIILDSIADNYEERGGGIILKEISGGYQFVTRELFADDIRRALFFSKKESLSRGMIETLSIIAYKQPIILAQVDELRGVSSRMMLAKLMKKNLVKPVGRKELPGRPLLYGTTDEFLQHFGLKDLSDLPTLSEIEEFHYQDSE